MEKVKKVEPGETAPKVLFTKMIKGVQVTVIEMNQPSEKAIKAFNEGINEIAASLVDNVKTPA